MKVLLIFVIFCARTTQKLVWFAFFNRYQLICITLHFPLFLRRNLHSVAWQKDLRIDIFNLRYSQASRNYAPWWPSKAQQSQTEGFELIRFLRPSINIDFFHLEGRTFRVSEWLSFHWITLYNVSYFSLLLCSFSRTCAQTKVSSSGPLTDKAGNSRFSAGQKI